MRVLSAFLAVVAALAAGDSVAASPSAGGRSLGAPGRVLTLGLTGRHVAIAVGTTRKQCPQVQLWLTESDVRVRFPWRLAGCKEGPSTGFGVPSVALARTRLVWLSYIGGNLRDWQLWTATPTRRAARLLRFVERDVDEPAPVVLGPGTPEGIPYAVDREVVYLGENGAAIFRTAVQAPVRALAAHAGGRFGVIVAALLTNGTIVGLDRSGRERLREAVPVTVSAIGLDDRIGLAFQNGSLVRFPGGSVTLPAGARMVDLGEGRILWVRTGDLGLTTLRGVTTRVVDGTPTRPAYGQIEPAGLAWAAGPTLRWRPAPLP